MGFYRASIEFRKPQKTRTQESETSSIDAAIPAEVVTLAACALSTSSCSRCSLLLSLLKPVDTGISDA